MGAPRDALLRALDAVDTPVRLFVRDDDAGWADESLLALLDVMRAADVPIDLAAIPAALTPALVHQLQARRCAGQVIGVHQHGFAHLNHETEGRRCEFGASRSAAQREADLRHGRDQLNHLLGGGLDPIFTPPWNRVSSDTPALLRALGYAALSRDVTAPVQDELAEISVHTDWTKQWRLAAQNQSDPVQRIAGDLARHASPGACVGLMLHHAVMAPDERESLEACLLAWRAHPNARWVSMGSLLASHAAPQRHAQDMPSSAPGVATPCRTANVTG
jgi:predicted deacetylase